MGPKADFVMPADLLIGNWKLETDEDDNIVEISPDKRYVRYNEILGRGAYKIVYKGFDEVDGIEVAWNQVNISDALLSSEHLEKLYSEVHLLKILKHENIIKSYASWIDDKNKTINMITELFTSGSLRQYRKKHKSVDMKAIKNWARQILRGLHYLHSHSPAIIHRDLKCDNIFVNGNHGEVKIGDLGLAMTMQQLTAHSVVGTPEFMAPELYDEEYNELVDIYSFGMCMLELITCEYPYNECKNQAQIYRKVTSGIKPAGLGKIKDTNIQQFIEKCLLPATQRFSAAELLKDPFLSAENARIHVYEPLQFPYSVAQSMNFPKPDCCSTDINLNYSTLSGSVCTSGSETFHVSALELKRVAERNEFQLRGEKNDDNSISLTLHITELCGRKRSIHFMLYPDADTALSIAGEMVEELDLLNEDVVSIAELIDSLALKLIPGWMPSIGSSVEVRSSHDDSAGFRSDQSCVDSRAVEVVQGTTELHISYELAELENHGDELSFETLKKYNAVSAFIGKHGKPLYSSDFGEYSRIHNKCDSGAGESSIAVSEYTTNSCNASSTDLNFSPYYLSLDERDHSHELKLEIDAIDTRYHQCCHDLLRMREEAIENAKKRWVSRKKVSCGGLM